MGRITLWNWIRGFVLHIFQNAEARTIGIAVRIFPMQLWQVFGQDTCLRTEMMHSPSDETDRDVQGGARMAESVNSGTRMPSFISFTYDRSAIRAATAWATFAAWRKSWTISRILGATAIWLLPFYPSPLRDDGYDIADYIGIHPNYGTLHDFKVFLAPRTAGD